MHCESLERGWYICRMASCPMHWLEGLEGPNDLLDGLEGPMNLLEDLEGPSNWLEGLSGLEGP